MANWRERWLKSNDNLAVSKESERVIADFERRIVELEGHPQKDQFPHRGHRPEAESKVEIKVRWREGRVCNVRIR